MKKIEILIVVAALLLIAALVGGCKDEAEAREHIEGQIAWLDKMYIFDGYDYIPTISDRPKPTEPKLNYTVEELDKIYKDVPTLCKLVKRLYGYGEPNEPTVTIELLAIEPTDDRAVWIDEEEWPPNVIKVNDGHKQIEYIPKQEPNEPEFVASGIDWDSAKTSAWTAASAISYSMCCGKCGKDLSPYEYVTANAHQCGVEPKPLLEMLIPTWPDYIELKNDLVFDSTHKNDPNKPWILWSSRTMSKGTKIYFKDKEQ